MTIKRNDKLRVIRESGEFQLREVLYAASNESQDLITVSRTRGGEAIGDGAWSTDRFEAMPSSLDFDKPVQTRDGRPVTIITAKGRDSLYPVIAYIGDNDGVTMYTAEGYYFANREDTDFDLVNVPTEIVTYINVFENGFHIAYTSREAADRGARDRQDRIGCNRVVLAAKFDI